METIQQRLIWFLGMVSILIIYGKLKPNHIDVNENAGMKLKAGLGLMLFGLASGIITRSGLLGESPVRSGLAFYLENIIGYLIGWCLVIWGLIEWLKEEAGETDILSGSRGKRFTEKLALALIRERNLESFFETIAKYLAQALNGNAVTLHVREGKNLTLRFQHGLPAGSEQAIANPDPMSPISAAVEKSKIIIADDPLEVHAAGLLGSLDRPVNAYWSVPIESGQAVLTIYFPHPRNIGESESSLLNDLVLAFAIYLKRESFEQERAREIRMRERMAAYLQELAASISDALVRYRDKRVLSESGEGRRWLGMINHKDSAKHKSGRLPGVRSRVKGPLAGVMTSGENPNGGQQGLDGDAELLLSDIEKNAVKIRELSVALVERQ